MHLRWGRGWAVPAAALCLTACTPSADLVTPAPLPTGPASQSAVTCGSVAESEPDPPEHVAVGTALEYAAAPPTSGRHWSQWPDLDRTLYTAADRPPVEQLVHSEEHGWTVVWYDETIAGDPAQLIVLQDLATLLAEAGPAKVVVVPWTSDDGRLDFGHLAMTHWGADTAYRQFCDGVDPATILAFATDHPYTDSLEPGGP